VVSAALVHTEEDGTSEVPSWFRCYLTGMQDLRRWYQQLPHTQEAIAPVRCSCIQSAIPMEGKISRGGISDFSISKKRWCR
jgi:hypothetical protein